MCLVVSVVVAESRAYGEFVYVPDHYPTIQGAIDAAHDGDMVIVRAGTYVENIDFLGKAITVRSESGPHLTVIDGSKKGTVVSFVKGEAAACVLEGFTIRNGIGTDLTGYGYYAGGGVLCLDSSPTIIGNVFVNNACVGGYGGGLLARGSSSRIVGNLFAGNSAFGGGGLSTQASACTVMDNEFDGNVAKYGGGISAAGDSSWIGGNKVVYNRAYDVGGGVFVANGAGTVIIYNDIRGNLAEHDGGGIRSADGGFPAIVNNMVSGNEALYNGGGVSIGYEAPARIANNTVIGNVAGKDGGGISVCPGCSGTIVGNSVLWSNSAPRGAEIALEFEYGWGPSELSLAYCDVAGGTQAAYVEQGCVLNWGPGMVDGDPLFADAGSGDYHLRYDSPCRDSGYSYTPSPATDFEGDPRTAEGSIDIGADEVYPHLYHAGSAVPGGAVTIKVVGRPGASALLGLGAGVQDPPQTTPYGGLYLEWPIGRFRLGTIGSDGVLRYPATAPAFWLPGENKPLQVLLGAVGNSSPVLTNLHVLVVE
ncbi:MAG: right-handed parallel beta-helix repeat-containing protein [Candidatus Zixiibacteriota bacterium]